MAELVDTITVRLKYSKTGAEANINASDFDPAKHARMDEVWPPAGAARAPSGADAGMLGMPASRRRRRTLGAARSKVCMATTLFSYDPTLPTDRDWVRYYIGDTSADHAEVDDRELDALLAEEPAPDPLEDPTPAEVRSYRKTIASRGGRRDCGASMRREADVAFEHQRTSLSAKFAQFTKLAEQLRTEADVGRDGRYWWEA